MWQGDLVIAWNSAPLVTLAGDRYWGEGQPIRKTLRLSEPGYTARGALRKNGPAYLAKQVWGVNHLVKRADRTAIEWLLEQLDHNRRRDTLSNPKTIQFEIWDKTWKVQDVNPPQRPVVPGESVAVLSLARTEYFGKFSGSFASLPQFEAVGNYQGEPAYQLTCQIQEGDPL